MVNRFHNNKEHEHKFADSWLNHLVSSSPREKELYLKIILSNAPIILFVEDREGIVDLVAGKGLKTLGFTPDDVIGRSIFDIFPHAQDHRENRNRALRGESFTAKAIAGEAILEIWYSPLRNSNGEISGVLGVVTDITKQAEAEKSLSEKNIALRELISGIEEQRNEIGRNILANVDKIIMPLIHVLEQGLPKNQQKYTDLLKQRLKEITSPFVNKLLSKPADLTPTEIRICDLVRRGLSNKEIARLQRCSADTVHKHRSHIRRKLGIRNRKNLAAHLEHLMPSSQEEH